jgi:hypothetical protein
MAEVPILAKAKKSSYTRKDQAAFSAYSGLDYVGPIEITHDFGDGQKIANRRFISETYAFQADELGEWIFDVRGIKDGIVSGKIPFQMFDAEMIGDAWYQHILSKGGVERERIDAIRGKDLRRPGILCIMTDKWQALIDGNHRLCARYERGARTFRYAGVSFADVWSAKCVCRPGDEQVIFGARHCEPGDVYLGGSYTRMDAASFKKLHGLK